MSEFVKIIFEDDNRSFHFDEDTVILTITQKYIVNKEDLPQILKNIKALPDAEKV